MHADKHTETEIAKLDKIRAAAELNSPESGDLLRNAELFDVLGKLFSKPTPMDNDQQSSDQGSSASGSIQAPVFQTANVDQPQLRASGATGSTGITTGITNNSAKIDLSLHVSFHLVTSSRYISSGYILLFSISSCYIPPAIFYYPVTYSIPLPSSI